MSLSTKLFLLVGIGLTLSCTEKGRSLVLVDVAVDSSVTTVASVRAVVAQGGGALAQGDATWSAPKVEIGVYLAKSVSGSVQVIACGFNAQGVGVASASPMTVSVQPGATAGPVSLTLAAGAVSPLCGTGVNGSGGAGGAVGIGGMGGSAGAIGRGGSAGGLGGAGGQPGTGGSTTGTGGATGGSGGTGGMNTGGAKGGAGGTGTGGAQGGNGGMGTGGAKGGSGGTGTGGTGTGGTGTGGTGTGGAKGGNGGTSTGGTGAGGSGAPSWANAVGFAGAGTSIQLNPAVAVDPSGNAVVVFQNGSAIYANHYDATQNSWGTPTPLDARGLAYEPKVAVDKNGIYVAVWGIPNDTTYKGIWTSTSSDGVNWSTPPTAITTTSAWSPVISMNANGDAVVAWTESISNNWQVAAAMRTGGNNPSWGGPTVLLTSKDDGDRNPAAVISGTGEAFVGWEQTDGTSAAIDVIWMAQHTSSGWGKAFVFDDDMAGAYKVSLAANKSGAVIATYLELTPTNSLKLWSRRYTPGSGFAGALGVTEANEIDETLPPALVLDDTGVATVAWNVQVGTDFEVHASRSAASDTSWPAETPIETDDTAADDDPNNTDQTAHATMPLLGCDPAGNVTLVWRKRTTASGQRYDLVSRRLPVGGTWNPVIPVESMDTLSVFFPALAVGTNGTAVAAWYYSTDTSSAATVWASVSH
jgi:hypothetical protein